MFKRLSRLWKKVWKNRPMAVLERALTAPQDVRLISGWSQKYFDISHLAENVGFRFGYSG